MDIEEIAVNGRKNIILMDNNVLASDYGLQQIEKIVTMGVRVDFNQGLDARDVYKRQGLYSSASRPTTNRLPLPKYRPYFDKWKDNVSPYVSRRELDAVAYALDVSLCHVRKVYAGTSMSENVARYITLAAKKNRREGRVYQKAVPVYEQLSIEWNEELDAKGNVKAVIKEPTATL